MIGLISPDRWTCPQCGRTETPHAGDGAAMQRAIRRAQERHTRRHNQERAALRLTASRKAS